MRIRDSFTARKLRIKNKVKDIKKIIKKKLLTSRDGRASRKYEMGGYPSTNWSLMFPSSDNSDEMWKIFQLGKLALI